MVVYIDTGAWIALASPQDAYHREARQTQGRLRAAHESLLTGWHTLVEFADGLSDRIGQRASATRLMQLLESDFLVVEPSEPYRERALEIFTTRPDWNVDLSDCFSFALMEGLGVRRAFAYDSGFAKAGFEVIG